MPLAPIDEDSGARRAMRTMTAILVVLVVCALFPYTPHPASDIKYAILACGVLLLSALRMLDAWGDRTPVRRPALLFYIVLALLTMNVIAALASSHVRPALDASGRLASFVLLFMLVAHSFRTREQVWQLLTVVCVSVAVSSAYGLVQKAGLDPFPWAMRDVEEYTAMPATFGNPNVAAHTLLLALMMAAGLALRRGTRWCVIPGLLIGVHFFLTNIRSGRVALLAACLTVIVAEILRRRTQRPLRASVMTCIAVVLAGAIGAGAVLGVGAIRTGRAMPLDTSLLARYNSNFGAARMILDRPFLGYGPANYAIENPPYWTPHEQRVFAVTRVTNVHVHNDYLEYGVDAGLPGLALYIGFLTCAIVWGLAMACAATGWDERLLAYTFTACFVGFAVDGLFGFNGRVPVSGALVFILAGLLEGLVRRSETASPPPMPSTGLRSKPSMRLLLAGGAILALALVLAAVEARTFAGQFLIQRAKGATVWDDSDAAGRILAKAEVLLPSNPKIPIAMGTIDLQQGRLEQALERFEKSLQLNPNSTGPLVALGRTYLRLHDRDGAGAAGAEHLEKAEAFENRALALCPKLPGAHEVLGNIWALRAIGEAQLSEASRARAFEAWGKANAHFQEALRQMLQGARAGDKGRLQKKMAHALMERGERSAAERLLRAAAQSQPADAETWQLFSQFAAEHGAYDVLTKSLGTALERVKRAEPFDSDTFIALSSLLARVYRQDLGDARAAENRIRDALGFAPHRLDLWGIYAEQFGGGQDQRRTHNNLRKTAKDMAAEGKAVPEAITALLDVFDGKPEAGVEAVGRLRRICEVRAQTAEADVIADEWRWVVDLLLPGLARARFSAAQRALVQRDLASISWWCESWSVAESLLAEALPQLPKDLKATASLQRAEALSRLERHEEALAMVREALRLAPKSLQARVVFAQKLAAAGLKGEARLEYTFLLQSTGLEAGLRAQLQDEYDTLTTPAAESTQENVEHD